MRPPPAANEPSSGHKVKYLDRIDQIRNKRQKEKMSLACSVQAGKHTPVEASAAMVRSVDIEASEPRQDRVHLMHISNEGGYPDADDDRGWRVA